MTSASSEPRGPGAPAEPRGPGTPATRRSGARGRAELVMSQRDFDAIRGFVHRAFGIALSQSKQPLVRMRLRGIVHGHGLASAREYVDRILANPTSETLSELADAITTNHTFFWRESTHFELLQQRIIPELMARQQHALRPTVRVWCAAASSGQEPYTLAAALRLTLGPDFDRWETGVLATDLSARALERARAGVYTSAEVAPLPDPFRRVMFDPAPDGYSVRPELRRDVTLRRLNLLTPFHFKQPFDVVFCRNVMIYFDDPTKLDLAARLAEVVRPGGYLVVGLSESLGLALPGLRAVAPAVYQKLGAP